MIVQLIASRVLPFWIRHFTWLVTYLLAKFLHLSVQWQRGLWGPVPDTRENPIDHIINSYSVSLWLQKTEHLIIFIHQYLVDEK